MRWCSDAACGLPLFSPHFTKKMILACSPIHMAESADDSHEAGTEEIKSIFTSDRDQEIFLTISNRYIRRENAADMELLRQAEEANRKYYTEFRRDALRTMHPDHVVENLISRPQALPVELYRPGLEKAYPMFYLTIGIQMFGLGRVGELLCTRIFSCANHPIFDADAVC